VGLSILILTFNEEKNLPGCLEALRWCDDIVVLDSNSTDGTVDIAGKFGARVYQRAFENFAGQRNFGLASVSFKHEWVFHLDADEVFTEALREEVGRTIMDTSYDAFYVPSKMMFQGKWLRFSGMYPAYQVRLTRVGRFTFRQVGHGQKEDIERSRIGTLNEPYLHYSFSKGMEEWFERHNRYSSMEAEETLQDLKTKTIDWKGILSGDLPRRRQALKRLSFRLPLRPLMRFVYMYFLRLGFLDGRAGFVYSRLLSTYEFMIAVKVRELRRANDREESRSSVEKSG
jgi:glycosyltransferase involved in cell wall biosynthesis